MNKNVAICLAFYNLGSTWVASLFPLWRQQNRSIMEAITTTAMTATTTTITTTTITSVATMTVTTTVITVMTVTTTAMEATTITAKGATTMIISLASTTLSMIRLQLRDPTDHKGRDFLKNQSTVDFINPCRDFMPGRFFLDLFFSKLRVAKQKYLHCIFL